MLFLPRLVRCWSTAGQSPLIDSAKTRFKISHLTIDEAVLLSNSTLEALLEGTASAPGLGGLREGRRLEGFELVPPLGMTAMLPTPLTVRRSVRNSFGSFDTAS